MQTHGLGDRLDGATGHGTAGRRRLLAVATRLACRLMLAASGVCAICLVGTVPAAASQGSQAHAAGHGKPAEAASAPAGVQAMALPAVQDPPRPAARPLGTPRPHLRVQLLWKHQSQFAGFYVAQARKHFDNEDLDVVLLEGGPGINPITEIQEGRADVAVSWLGNAWNLSQPGREVTHVAQIFSGSALSVLCRISAGTYTPADMRGKSIGVWGLGDQNVVAEMLRSLSIPRDSVKLQMQPPDGAALVDGRVPCATAMTYNEYWQVMAAGLPSTDLIVLSPTTFKLAHLEDGLYVLHRRLNDPAFRDQLVRLTRALRQGWLEARIAPTLAVETVQRVAAGAPRVREHQQHMLETVLGLIPERPEEFGRLDLARYETQVKRLLQAQREHPRPDTVWTYEIWNRLAEQDGRSAFLSQATRHYVNDLASHPAFKLMLFLGVLIYALSGVLEAIDRQYDLWGRLALAMLSGVGGGTLRDLLIGGDRLPFYYVVDIRYPLGILLVVVLTSVAVLVFPAVPRHRMFRQVKTYSDILGFSVLAVTGAMIAISSGLAWFWAPVCAALTCAGGGMLRDIVINLEPHTFKGLIYEEVAVVGALVLLAGFAVANQFEQSRVPVLASVLGSIVLIAALRAWVFRSGLCYPKWLGGQGADHH